MSNKKIEITRIILQMGEVRVELSLKDAEELYNSLDKMFGNKTTYVPYSTPYIRPYYPYTPKPWWYSPSYGTITCGDSGNQWSVGKNLKASDGTLEMNFSNLSSARLSS